jgi:hypothetical protein
MSYDDSVAAFGIEHTHERSCRTWAGRNWVGACDCALDSDEFDTGCTDECADDCMADHRGEQ